MDHFVYKMMVNSAHSVQPTLPRVFSISFQYSRICYSHIKDVHKEEFGGKNNFGKFIAVWASLFILSLQCICTVFQLIIISVKKAELWFRL